MNDDEDEHWDGSDLTVADFGGPELLDIDLLLLVYQFVEQNNANYTETDLDVSSAIIRALFKSPTAKKFKSLTKIVESLGYISMRTTNKTKDEIKLTSNGSNRIANIKLKADPSDDELEVVLHHLNVIIAKTEKYILRGRDRKIVKNLSIFSPVGYNVSNHQIKNTETDRYIVDINWSMLENQEEKYLKGGVHGRRQKPSGEGLVQAKYWLKGELRTAISKAAAATGLSTSNFLQQKLLDDPDIAEFFEPVVEDEPDGP